MTTEELITLFVERGDLEATLESCRRAGVLLQELSHDGLNIVNGTIIANISHEARMALLDRVGELVTDQGLFEKLLREKIHTISPQTVHRLRDRGIEITPPVIAKHADDYDVFELAVPHIPLVHLRSILGYLKIMKGIRLRKNEKARIIDLYVIPKLYRRREVEEALEGY